MPTHIDAIVANGYCDGSHWVGGGSVRPRHRHIDAGNPDAAPNRRRIRLRPMRSIDVCAVRSRDRPHRVGAELPGGHTPEDTTEQDRYELTRDRADTERGPQGVARSFFGTAVEAYDFMVFTFLIAYLSPLFFPSDNPTAGVLSTLAVLGTGFLARPIGGIVFGRIGDRYGRRFALIVTISGMGGVTILMGLLPTHATVGILAPVLLVLTRMLQASSPAASRWVRPPSLPSTRPPRTTAS